MDHMSDKEKFAVEKSNGLYGSINTAADWRVCISNESNHVGSYPQENPMSSSQSQMRDSFGQALWNDPINVQTTGFGGFNVQNNVGSSNLMGIANGNLGSFRSNVDRSLEMGWNLSNGLSKGNGFLLPNVNGFLPHSMVQFPTDSGFIERAARFSCFGGGNFSEMMNQSLGVPESMALYSQAGQGLQNMQMGTLVNGRQCTNVDELTKDASTDGFKNETGVMMIHVGSNDEVKIDKPGSSNMSDETRSSEGNCRNETSSKGIDTKKRKRNGQESEQNQSRKDHQSGEEADNNGEKKQKDEQNTNKTSGGKQGKQISDPPKEGYIHVRARRGQATNSHSLAERVRREKISERMKFLQDLVPGCNKVTGKAVMLDEIINYVQSLQRQVEFLSMKLATVNPQLDFNLEGLLAKEALQLRPGPSSAPPFPSNISMAYPPLSHLSQPGFIQPILSGIGNPSDVIRRTITSPPMNAAGGFKRTETHGWESDLQNVVQMSYGTAAPPENQEATESVPTADMKVEQ